MRQRPTVAIADGQTRHSARHLPSEIWRQWRRGTQHGAQRRQVIVLEVWRGYPHDQDWRDNDADGDFVLRSAIAPVSSL